LEGVFVEVRGKTRPKGLGLHADYVIESYKRITKYVRGKGAVIVAQLNHGGIFSVYRNYEHLLPLHQSH
jgi:2,4-dienoyl-CoA reductase-like NADH-dependent reductase (Old Yellow Enzyme family)